MIDGYTTTDRYPYAEPVRGMGNYIRNSVKVTVDAYDGTVTFYVADAAGPDRAHVRRGVPGAARAARGDARGSAGATSGIPRTSSRSRRAMYATYHMEDPRSSTTRRTCGPSRGGRRGTRPRDGAVLHDHAAARRDEGGVHPPHALQPEPPRQHDRAGWPRAPTAPHYGRLVVYNFPKQKLVFGPRQIDARIDQDPVISQQLSLWNQRGSTVIRGCLLAIPIEESLIYVQPLYLARRAGGASRAARVIVAYGNQIAMGETLDAALQSIFGGRAGASSGRAPEPSASPPIEGLTGLVGQAWDAWSRGQDALRRGDWSAYGDAQRRLEEALRGLRERAPR